MFGIRAEIGEGAIKVKSKDFLVINSFTTQVFGGNPAAVFYDAADIKGDAMQSIARQMNLVETVFIRTLPGNEPADFEFRYFTPAEELPIAGHPTIAGILALIETGRLDPARRNSCRIETKAGVKDIQLTNDPFDPLIMMEQQAPLFLAAVTERGKAAGVLGLQERDLLPELPVQAVDTGLGHMIVPVRSLEALMRVQRKIEALGSLCRELGVREAQVFTFETHDPAKTLHTRNICPREGIEDPGCGVGNGALGAYLLKNYYQDQTAITLAAEQGNMVNMPCVINISAVREGESMRVAIGGHGKVMIRGAFFLE